MNLLSVSHLTHSYGEKPLIRDASFGIDDGQRVAIVGPNGAGKTTLMRIIAGLIEPSAGEVMMQGEATMGYLPQRVGAADEATPREVVAIAIERARRALEEHEEVSHQIGLMDPTSDALAHALERQATLADRVTRLGGWDWERRVEEMVDRLGLSEVMERPMAALSGGQRRRVDLARSLLAQPDLLMLDEPTNHLDTEAVDWLQGWLVSRPGALLLITHDRYFLERVADRILEIDGPQIFDHPANYQTFITRRFERMEVRARAEKRREKMLEREAGRLDRQLRGKQGRSQHHVNLVEQLSEEGLAAERRMEMNLSDGPEFGRTVFSVSGLWISRGGRPILEGAGLSLAPRQRIGIVGPNGCGKTTTLEVVVGSRRADAGVIERGEHTKIGYMPQTGLGVEPHELVYDVLGPSDYVWIGDQKHHKQRLLERFLFDRRLQKARVSVLSGGQRRRLALARLVAQNANLLIMDEPTNDLDIISLQVLEDALIDFAGCALIVSHDRYFLDRVCTSIVSFEDLKLERYEGNWSDFARAKRAKLEAMKEAEAPKPRPKPKTQRKPSNASKTTSYKKARELESLEAEIEALELRMGEVDHELGSPQLYASHPERIEPLNRERLELEHELEAAYERWAELEE